MKSGVTKERKIVKSGITKEKIIYSKKNIFPSFHTLCIVQIDDFVIAV